MVVSHVHGRDIALQSIVVTQSLSRKLKTKIRLDLEKRKWQSKRRCQASHALGVQ